MTYVFDLDGTLIDSRRRHWMLMEKLLKKSGVPIDKNFADSFLQYKANGNSGKKYLSTVLQLDVKTSEEIQSEWIKKIEDEEWLQYDELFTDTVKTLQCITSEILLLTIRENIVGLHNEICRLGLEKYPLLALSHSKTKSDILKRIDNCIMIGDTEVDYLAAVDAKTKYYILNRGFRSKEYWDKMGVVSYPDLYSLYMLCPKK